MLVLVWQANSQQIECHFYAYVILNMPLHLISALSGTDWVVLPAFMICQAPSQLSLACLGFCHSLSEFWAWRSAVCSWLWSSPLTGEAMTSDLFECHFESVCMPLVVDTHIYEMGRPPRTKIISSLILQVMIPLSKHRRPFIIKLKSFLKMLQIVYYFSFVSWSVRNFPLLPSESGPLRANNIGERKI